MTINESYTFRCFKTYEGDRYNTNISYFRHKDVYNSAKITLDKLIKMLCEFKILQELNQLSMNITF